VDYANQFARVNSLSRIVRYIFWGILLGGIVSLLRLRAPSSAYRVAGAPSNSRSRFRPTPLFRDPACGTFVSPEISVAVTRAGQEIHFCSEQCRDRYLRSERYAATA
jgi:YHS domain-containing protein